jgi:hypothetical protein
VGKNSLHGSQRESKYSYSKDIYDEDVQYAKVICTRFGERRHKYDYKGKYVQAKESISVST